MKLLSISAIKRLGGGKVSSSQKWRKPKASQKSSQTTAASSEDKANMMRLTELADELLANSHLEIYEATFEKLAFLVKQDSEKKLAFLVKQDSEKEKEADQSSAPAVDDLDMFSDDVNSASKTTATAGVSTTSDSKANESDKSG